MLHNTCIYSYTTIHEPFKKNYCDTIQYLDLKISTYKLGNKTIHNSTKKKEKFEFRMFLAEHTILEDTLKL